METIITTCGWVLFGLLTAATLAFSIAFIWGCGFLGYHLSTRMIREQKRWKKAIRDGNYKVTQYAAIVMCDRLGYGETATLGDIIHDTDKKIKNNREK